MTTFPKTPHLRVAALIKEHASKVKLHDQQITTLKSSSASQDAAIAHTNTIVANATAATANLKSETAAQIAALQAQKIGRAHV